MNNFTESDLDDLQYSEEYAEYIMENGDNSIRIICNGDTLLQAQEDGYLFEEFCADFAQKLLT
jgi:hypothetical protein